MIRTDADTKNNEHIIFNTNPTDKINNTNTDVNANANPTDKINNTNNTNIINLKLWFRICSDNNLSVMSVNPNPIINETNTCKSATHWNYLSGYDYYSIDKTPSLHKLVKVISSRKTDDIYSSSNQNIFIALDHGIITLKLRALFKQIKILNYVTQKIETFNCNNNNKYELLNKTEMYHLNLVPYFFSRKFNQCFIQQCIFCKIELQSIYELNECICDTCVIHDYDVKDIKDIKEVVKKIFINKK
jgi:hypothetical protein